MRFLALCLVAVLAACVGSAAEPPRVLELQQQNDSGVIGTVTLTSAGEDRTLVEILVDPNGHPDMPAHVHPGSCDAPVPQPMFPLENVRDGVSSTEIPIALSELLASQPVSVNVHDSNEQMQIFTACVDVS